VKGKPIIIRKQELSDIVAAHLARKFGRHFSGVVVWKINLDAEMDDGLLWVEVTEEKERVGS